VVSEKSIGKELQMTEKGYLCADVFLKPVNLVFSFFANKRFDRIYLTVMVGVDLRLCFVFSEII